MLLRWRFLALDLGFVRAGLHFKKEGSMENQHKQALRGELVQLLRMQNELLESRTFGSTTDTEILEYELRQEVIHDICERLAQSDLC